ncbi:DUF3916 domain-containing protein [Planococcus sp. N028]|uniref:DUF3916 domain-containing protein n=1 Tax=Planococcus shixiaomingii TaxID=3058393 RepID=A0ABT8MYX3_9BACL|nr:DUF3916 domain-containing protein [Planococcus sp. N028]MDN7240840.1 DUF3916 domain-containing protein [Planococcus sp. N028]
MRNKKVRGLKRKTAKLIERIEEETSVFPEDSYGGYWCMSMPAGKSFIDSPKTPVGVKRICVKTLLARAEYLIKQKPMSAESVRVVVMVASDELFSAQIIVFFGSHYLNPFFNRSSEHQLWVPLAGDSGFTERWELEIPENMIETGYREIINYEDEKKDRTLWFIGELA